MQESNHIIQLWTMFINIIKKQIYNSFISNVDVTKNCNQRTIQSNVNLIKRRWLKVMTVLLTTINKQRLAWFVIRSWFWELISFIKFINKFININYNNLISLIRILAFYIIIPCNKMLSDKHVKKWICMNTIKF